MTTQIQSKKKRRPSLRTVAKHVGLSATAVSLALRGDESIPLETRQRVAAAAAELDYNYTPRQPKRPAKALRRLVYVVNDYGDEPVTANPFYGYILQGAEQTSQAHHASLSYLVMPHNYPPNKPLPPVLTQELDGILMASPYPRAVIDRIQRESARPLVLIDNAFPGTPYDAVLADDFGGAYQITQHLIQLGHQNIRMITGYTQNPEIPPSFVERARGFHAACADAGLPGTEPLIVPTEADPPFDLEKFPEMEKWLEGVMASENRPTALFCAADFYAVAIIEALTKHGCAVPEDISVAGYDDFEIARKSQPALTSVHTYKRAMARTAVSLLLDRIEGDNRPPLHITLATQLVTRDSTGKRPSR
ncbi:MAG: LacI family DNA-binding transcriptional regulator [Anaerolineales bacterium]|nr:LacI family DNA-binding transcriptional regulator [Anaerolineales bacterium]